MKHSKYHRMKEENIKTKNEPLEKYTNEGEQN